MPEAGISRGSERVTLACRALSAAAADLRVACARDGVPAAWAVEDAAEALDAESVRVCELAEELEELAEALANGWGKWEAKEPTGLPDDGPR
jgi:hypothetical protein